MRSVERSTEMLKRSYAEGASGKRKSRQDDQDSQHGGRGVGAGRREGYQIAGLAIAKAAELVEGRRLENRRYEDGGVCRLENRRYEGRVAFAGSKSGVEIRA